MNFLFVFIFFFVDVKSELNKYLGLILAFSLPKSSYATMALREILHRNESQLQTHHQQEQLITTTKNVNQEDEDEEIEEIEEIEDILM